MLPLTNNPKQTVSIIVYELEIWGLFLRIFCHTHLFYFRGKQNGIFH